MGRRDFQGRTDIRKAAIGRLSDAEKLVRPNGDHGQGAKYLAGYAVECKLKAIAMEIHDCWKLEELIPKMGIKERDIYTHGLESFASKLPFYDRFRQSNVWHDFASQVNSWRPSWRYSPKKISPKQAKPFIQAVQKVIRWLDRNTT